MSLKNVLFVDKSHFAVTCDKVHMLPNKRKSKKFTMIVKFNLD